MKYRRLGARDLEATHRTTGDFVRRCLGRDTLERVEKLKIVAKEAGCTLAQFVLAWALREDNVASAIVGGTKPEQIEENAGASGVKIDPALLARTEAILAVASR
jgi:1-deoxyxylulose-5-phosphate synthase